MRVPEQFPHAWDELAEKLPYMPAFIKSIEKTNDTSRISAYEHHEDYELVYMKKGSALFQIEGMDVAMPPHSILIIKPGKAHKASISSEPGEFLIMRFSLKTYGEESENHLSLTHFIAYLQDEATGDFLHIKLPKKNDILRVLNSILHERTKYQVWGDFLSCLFTMELFVLLSRALKQNTKNKNLKLQELLNIAKEYIDNNYGKELTLTHVAKYSYLSDSYFAHSFKNKFGISPKSYILKVRIASAKNYLQNTDMKVSEIAKTVGFSSQQRFNDIFKKHEHMTPLNYRQICKAERIHTLENLD